MKKTLLFKVFSGYCIVTIVLSTLILAFSFPIIRHYHIETVAGNLKDLATVLKPQLTSALIEENSQRLDSIAKSLGSEIRARITVITLNGKVLADSDENPSVMDNHRTRTEVAQALEGTTGSFVRFSNTMKKEMLYVAIPIEKDKKIIGVIRVSQYLENIDNITNKIRVKIFQIALLIIGISLLAAFIFSRNLSRPLRELTNAAQRVAKNDFDVKVFLKNKDELRDLAESFNFMVGRIKTLFAELYKQKEEWNSIILSLREGFLILDKDEKVIFFNESFESIINNTPEKGRFYWEVIREPKLSELIREVRETKRDMLKEIEFNNRTFSCSATFLLSQKEIAIVFHDITDIKNLEKIKTDFVQNISHELRTPLTSIKGFIETLGETVKNAEQRRYIDIVKRNTDRLINIISDLLLLSELEERNAEPEYEKVDLKILIENSVKIFEQQLAEKGLSLTVTINPETPAIQGDAFKLEQMIINLLDNAIKYTDKGNISITLGPNGKTVILTVQDTGVGIPGDHLPRIFERFYVVDKSRSKKLGGTGLGLSIVKHIVILHNGKIDVESTLGVGTKCIVTFPLDPSVVL
ncbi:MAG: Alkaline phosphatase synthesis sensor protein PhoR [Syntrophorhabdus sp. PtaU1.Bin058]|nr:MAG: Alkaline phosphatase synthesis sensor protein PhoR [Syntrophorhabdus sp. PtaU1.Bin058]